MLAALPLHGGALPAAPNHAALANIPSANAAVDQAHVDSTAAHQVSHQNQHQTIPNEVEAFYAIGSDPLTIGAPGQGGLAHAPQGSGDYTNSSNLFTDSINSLQEKGGPSDPVAMLKFQAQMVETTLNWSLYGQMASKAVSGIQSLFNNQV